MTWPHMKNAVFCLWCKFRNISFMLAEYHTLILGIGLMNYIIDPYNKFGNNRLGVYISAEREFKATKMRTHAQNYDVILLGHSKAAMTDVTGFGLLGHLIEMAEGANLSAEINYSKIPLIDNLNFYTSQMCVPDNCFRNWSSYDPKVTGITGDSLLTLCDPQTNGGLLITIDINSKNEFKKFLVDEGFENFSQPIGMMKNKEEKIIMIV